SAAFSIHWGAAAGLGRAQIGAEVEQLVLDARQHCIGLARAVQSGEADRRVGLVDGAEGFDPERLLRDPATVAERGLALVAAAGVDAGQPDHRLSPRLNDARPASSAPRA